MFAAIPVLPPPTLPPVMPPIMTQMVNPCACTSVRERERARERERESVCVCERERERERARERERERERGRERASEREPDSFSPRQGAAVAQVPNAVPKMVVPEMSPAQQVPILDNCSHSHLTTLTQPNTCCTSCSKLAPPPQNLLEEKQKKAQEETDKKVAELMKNAPKTSKVNITYGATESSAPAPAKAEVSTARHKHHAAPVTDVPGRKETMSRRSESGGAG